MDDFGHGSNSDRAGLRLMQLRMRSTCETRDSFGPILGRAGFGGATLVCRHVVPICTRPSSLVVLDHSIWHSPPAVTDITAILVWVSSGRIFRNRADKLCGRNHCIARGEKNLAHQMGIDLASVFPVGRRCGL